MIHILMNIKYVDQLPTFRRFTLPGTAGHTSLRNSRTSTARQSVQVPAKFRIEPVLPVTPCESVVLGTT